jgi:nickel-dependent lactate racemase
MVAGKGSTGKFLNRNEVREIMTEGIPPELYRGKRVLVLTPDGTRTAPLPMMVRELYALMGGLAERLDFMVALGTHRPLSDGEILDLYGITEEERGSIFRDTAFLNHRWDMPGTLQKIGRFSASEIEELTGGLLREAVDVDINRRIFDYDLLIIFGPVFPHEVAGFSGGNKYLFPGISGGDFLHFFHWLGAVITCWNIIGIKHNPVRTLIETAASLVPVQRCCAAMVVDKGNGLHGLWVGNPEDAWSEAADLSAKVHIVRKEKPFHTVLGRSALLYDELWTAGKVMYKLEPVVEEGGRIIIYGTHVRALSHTWGAQIERIGYHVRDYFLSRMDQFREVPRGVLAHSTHVRGLGSFENGIERPRIEVILATSIAAELCRRVNLGYMNPDEIDIDSYRNREGEGILFVDDAVEVLHRLVSEQ